MLCPSCGFEQDDKNTECEKCQIVFIKWFKRHEPRSEAVTNASSLEPKVKSAGTHKLIWLVAVVVLAGIIFLRLYNKNEEIKNRPVSSVITGDKIAQISNGEQVDLLKYLESGKITVFDFYADWCGPCVALAPKLEKLAAANPDVVIRKINIQTWISPVSVQYNIKFVPNVRVYDKKGRMVGEPSANYSEIENNIRKSE